MAKKMVREGFGLKDGAGKVYGKTHFSTSQAHELGIQPKVEEGNGDPAIIKNRMETHHDAQKSENRRGR